MSAAAGVWAVVPMKSLRAAKQRLSPVLGPDERELLAYTMLEDVLAACAEARCVEQTLVVTGDDKVARLADRAGAAVLREGREAGTNAAAQAGIRSASGATAVMVLPADVPNVTGFALDAVAALVQRAPAIVLAPASRDGGTNLFACSPPDVCDPCFGPDSFARHLEMATRAGLTPFIACLRGLAIDVDRPEDLRAFLATPGRTRTHELLSALGVAARVKPGLALTPQFFGAA
jgi:2-phospho-L-lactate guanylyltransferase